MAKSVWITAFALSILAVPRYSGKAQKSKNPFLLNCESGSCVTTVPMYTAPEPEVRFGNPAVKDGRKIYSLDLKADWTCIATSNAADMRRGYEYYPTLVTVTCVKADPPAAK